MLAGNVSPMTGENVKPAYGGEEEAFLTKVVTPIYKVIAQVFHEFIFFSFLFQFFLCFLYQVDFIFRRLQGAKEKGQNILSGGIMMI